MRRSPQQLRDDALAIWHAGVEAVRSDRLVTDNVQVDGNDLLIADELLDLRTIRKIVVVGAGKAGAGMADGLLRALGGRVVQAKQLTGWINVPADCARALPHITLHAARPAGINEPTEAGVAGTEKILHLVQSLTADDLCLCLISGGGSALLPAPLEGISLANKQALTRHLSASGANIQELNTVRKQLSQIKGGGLARACRAGRLISLIISDVLGDPLDVIASGPTVVDSSTPEEALAVLRKFDALQIAPAATALLQSLSRSSAQQPKPVCHVTNLVIGNNAVAVDAAGIEAERRGYSHAMLAATSLEGEADRIGEHLADMAVRMRDEPGPDCLITGGEPTVRLASAETRGKGGRNQQLILAALLKLLGESRSGSVSPLQGIAMLAGGTDGEDGPTDAAGAWIDDALVPTLRALQLDPADYLRRNDAYNFFAQLDALVKTGPTHTNVCDIRVVVVDRVQAPSASRRH
jgi:glycerate 2-kinase